MSHSLHGVGVGPVLAVERLGQDPGGRSLADAAGAGEQIGVPDAVAGDRLLQRLGDVLLADELVERLRPIAPGDDDVLAGVDASFASRLVAIVGHGSRAKFASGE